MFPKISQVLREAYLLAKKNFFVIIGMSIVVGIFYVVWGSLINEILKALGLFFGVKPTPPGSLPYSVESPLYVILKLLLQLLSSLGSTYISISWLRFIIAIARGTKIGFKSFSSNLHFVIRYFFANIIYGIVVFFGFLLLIIPGIIWSIKYSYVLPLIVDKDLSLKDAFDTSRDMTAGVKWKMLTFGSVLFLIALVGILPVLLTVGSIFLRPEVLMSGKFTIPTLSSTTLGLAIGSVIFTALWTIIMMPFMSIAPYVLYNKLYERVSKPQAPETSAATAPPANLAV